MKLYEYAEQYEALKQMAEDESIPPEALEDTLESIDDEFETKVDSIACIIKMALTDAISVACKALGFGADVYWEAERTKYNADPPEQDEEYTCAQCGKTIRDGKKKDGSTWKAGDIALYAQKRYDRQLCFECLGKEIKAEKAAEKSDKITVSVEAAPTPEPSPTPKPTPEPTATPEPTYDSESTSEYAEEPETQSETVWLSRNGNKYHSTPDCGNMKDLIPTTLDDAIKRGRKPCSKCW